MSMAGYTTTMEVYLHTACQVKIGTASPRKLVGRITLQSLPKRLSTTKDPSGWIHAHRA